MAQGGGGIDHIIYAMIRYDMLRSPLYYYAPTHLLLSSTRSRRVLACTWWEGAVLTTNARIRANDYCPRSTLSARVRTMQTETTQNELTGEWGADGRPKLTKTELRSLLRKKIVERVILGSSILQTSFRLFGRPENGITVDIFRDTFIKLGVILSRKDAQAVFNTYDRKRTGRLSFNEFAAQIAGEDQTVPSWNMIRDREQWVEADKRAAVCKEIGVLGMGQKPLKYPNCMNANRMDLDAIERLVQRKIEGRAPRPEVQMQCAFKMFGSPKNGLTIDMFKTQLWRMGIPASEQEVEGLFKRYDKDGSGAVDFYEFIQGVMPSDYPTKLWAHSRDEEQWASYMKTKTEEFDPVPKQYPPCMKKFQYSTDDIEKVLRAKIDQRARSDMEKYLYAYFLFGRPEGHIEYPVFIDRVRKMGIPARDDQLKELFEKYDTDHDGKIDFYEMIRNILPVDYPQKSWGSKRQEEILTEEYERLQNGLKGGKKFEPNLTLAQDSSRCSSRQTTARMTARGKASSPYAVQASAGMGTARSNAGRPVSRQLTSRMKAIQRMRQGTPRPAASPIKAMPRY